MTKSMGAVIGEVYDLLKDLSESEKTRTLSAVATALGINGQVPIIQQGQTATSTERISSNDSYEKPTTKQTAKEYFESKAPQNKGEEFAVAAMYRQETMGLQHHTKEDLKDVIKNQAKRAFVDKNFGRDIENAIRQAKFFMKGDNKGEYTLSADGEKYVGALPDRSTARLAKKSKTKTTKKNKIEKS